MLIVLLSNDPTLHCVILLHSLLFMYNGFSVSAVLPKSSGIKMALCDMLKHKSIEQLLDDHKHLKLLIR